MLLFLFFTLNQAQASGPPAFCSAALLSSNPSENSLLIVYNQLLDFIMKTSQQDAVSAAFKQMLSKNDPFAFKSPDVEQVATVKAMTLLESKTSPPTREKMLDRLREIVDQDARAEEVAVKVKSEARRLALFGTDLLKADHEGGFQAMWQGPGSAMTLLRKGEAGMKFTAIDTTALKISDSKWNAVVDDFKDAKQYGVDGENGDALILRNSRIPRGEEELVVIKNATTSTTFPKDSPDTSAFASALDVPSGSAITLGDIVKIQIRKGKALFESFVQCREFGKSGTFFVSMDLTTMKATPLLKTSDLITRWMFVAQDAKRFAISYANGGLFTYDLDLEKNIVHELSSGKFEHDDPFEKGVSFRDLTGIGANGEVISDRFLVRTGTNEAPILWSKLVNAPWGAGTLARISPNGKTALVLFTNPKEKGIDLAFIDLASEKILVTKHLVHPVKENIPTRLSWLENGEIAFVYEGKNRTSFVIDHRDDWP